MSKKKILVVFNTIEPVSIDHDYTKEFKHPDWETERDVVQALQTLGHPTEVLGIYDDITLIRDKVNQSRPDIIFNLVERFKDDSAYDRDVASYLDLLGIPFTGCGTTGLTLCKNKGLSKKILSYHRIRVPKFEIFYKHKKPKRPKWLTYPLFIKPLREEASHGISQASFVEDDEHFYERLKFIHENMGHNAIVEEYIEGRELYVGVLGTERLKVFPPREIRFNQVPDDEPKFASYKAKWDEKYREKWGIKNQFAGTLPAGVDEKIQKISKKIYRLLSCRGYARLDMRLTPQGELVFIEANPNPMLAKEEDFAESAAKGGLPYPQLISQILSLSACGPEAERP